MAKRSGAVKPMKRGSVRDSLALVVRLLTRDGVQVYFRGFQPMVMTRGDKVVSMVLPEVGDDASEELINAIHGFLDHECGHIFFTPFARCSEFHNGNNLVKVLANIIEDIRLEKLLPRKMPGTKENLERMYEMAIPKMFHPQVEKAIALGGNAEQLMSVTMVPGMRAMAGQKAFQTYMDANNLWPHLTPLTSRMPTLAAELQGLETFTDVEKVVKMILDAMSPQQKQGLEQAPPPPGCGGDPADEDEAKKKSEQDDDSDSDADEGGDADGDTEDGDDKGDKSKKDADGADDDRGDDDGSEPDDGDNADDDGADSDGGGEGHGDGKGTDDGSDEEGGDCSGDKDESNPDHDGSVDGEEPGEDGDGEDSEEDGDGDSAGDDGKNNKTITDALKLLEPTQRRVLYMHKNKRRSVERIATDTGMSVSQVEDTLRTARRNLAEYMTGSK